MRRLLLCLVIIPLLGSGVYGQSARDRRHAEIHRKLANSSLEFPYFAPSVHIRYHHPDPEAQYFAYYNEISVEETFKHTYFCTIGFDVGYFGIQDHHTGPLAIFSVWDKGGGDNDSRSVDASDQTQVLYTNPDAQSSRFGGEGSGAKTMMPFPWEVDATYAFLVALKPLDQGTIYTAWIAKKGEPWLKIASYQTVETKKELKGFYSFIEDYVRNGETGQSRRKATYPFQAVLSAAGEWAPIINGSGTIADDIIQNGHSGVRDNVMFSQSGADTADYSSVPRRFSVTRSSMPDGFPGRPEDFEVPLETVDE